MAFAKGMKREESSFDARPRALAKSGIAAVAFVLGILVAAWWNGSGARAAQGSLAEGGRVPRFESLNSDRVILRNGPGHEFPISWVLTRAGLPVEIVREVGRWRQIRDADGTTGWAPAALLSARRTALVSVPRSRPGLSEPQAAELRQGPSDAAPVRGRLDKGMLVQLASCDGAWCKVAVEGKTGHVAQSQLWGVNPGERLR